ncbi:MAG TPA: response regulator [Pyrinomonadaceae bacterium]
MADDSVTIQKVVNLTFADEGIEVFAVGDGNEAIDRLLEISPDLVMADVNMPGINGYLVCERIKQYEKFKNTPVILLVGSFEPFDEQEARRVGADDYLTKPFQSIRQLVSKVSELLERSETENVEAAPTALENSFAETQEIETPIEAEVFESAETPRYEDAGYDDEMIQTNQASSFAFDEAQKFSSRNYVEPREEDYGKTQPLSASDLREIESAAPDAYVSPAQEDSSSQQTNSGEISPPAQTAPAFESSEDDDDFLELFDDDEFEDEEEEETENIQPQAEIAGADEVSAESRTAVSENESYQTTETESIQPTEAEIAQPVESETLEASETQNVQPEETENVYSTETESVQPEETQTVQTTETENAQPTETEAMAASASSQLSPEMIDAIAQRVIEKLSASAVKEIAWEVVPQQADLIIKKMVAEKLKE